jgi:hypothetical protein
MCKSVNDLQGSVRRVGGTKGSDLRKAPEGVSLGCALKFTAKRTEGRKRFMSRKLGKIVPMAGGSAFVVRAPPFLVLRSHIM